MKITNLGVSGTSLPSPQQVEGATPAPSDPTTPGSAPNSKGYSPSAELVNLLGLSRAQPEIRADRVQVAQQRLQQGDYHTADSADKTAEAMLGTLD